MSDEKLSSLEIVKKIPEIAWYLLFRFVIGLSTMIVLMIPIRGSPLYDAISPTFNHVLDPLPIVILWVTYITFGILVIQTFERAIATIKEEIAKEKLKETKR